MVEQRPLRRSPASPARSSTYAPPTSTRGAPTAGASREAERLLAAAASGSAEQQRDVVEVVLDAVVAPRRGRVAAPRRRRIRPPGRGARPRAPAAGERRVEVGTRSATCSSAPRSRGALRVEERQLAAPRVRADERERVRPLDHVHAELRRREVGDRRRGRRPRARRGRASSGSRLDRAYRAVMPTSCAVDGALELRLVHLRAALDAHPLAPRCRAARCVRPFGRLVPERSPPRRPDEMSSREVATTPSPRRLAPAPC